MFRRVSIALRRDSEQRSAHPLLPFAFVHHLGILRVATQGISTIYERCYVYKSTAKPGRLTGDFICNTQHDCHSVFWLWKHAQLFNCCMLRGVFFYCNLQAPSHVHDKPPTSQNCTRGGAKSGYTSHTKPALFVSPFTPVPEYTYYDTAHTNLGRGGGLEHGA